jgi:predicted GNAT family N-acyltransferase
MRLSEIHRGDPLYEQAIALRYVLFFKEHHLPEEIVLDEKELESTHIAVSEKGHLLAYGRLSKIGNDTYQISQMVVSPDYQHQGLGAQVLMELMRLAAANGARTITLNARMSALGFYERYGFIKYGEIFYSQRTNVPHIKMVCCAPEKMSM